MSQEDNRSTEDLIAETKKVLSEADKTLSPECSQEQRSRELTRVNLIRESPDRVRGEAARAPPSSDAYSQPTTVPGEWVEMRAPSGDDSAAIVRFNPKESARIVKHFENRQLTEATAWHGGNIGSVIVDQLAASSSLIASGLQAGQLFQVIGPVEAIVGLNAGTHEMMKAAGGGLRAIVTKRGSGSIVHHLKLAKASGALVMAPVIAWQVLHAIAGTTQLREINQRLDVMQRALESLQARQEVTVIGEVIHSVRKLNEILAERANTGRFTRDMETRLSFVEHSIGGILERNRILVERFRDKTDNIHGLKGKTGAVATSSLLLEEGGSAISDMKMLVALAAADLHVCEARLYHSMEHNPADLKRRLDATTAKVEEYREMLGNLPSVERLESHLGECVDEMGWWQRKVLARSARQGRNRVSSMQLRDVQPPKQADQAPLGSNYVFWRDESGDTHIHALPNEIKE